VKATSTLPIIDIAPWIEGHDHKGRLSTAVAKAAAIHAACLEFGFFYLDVSSFVPPDEPEELSLLARELFGLPQEEKDQISLNNQDCARGEPAPLTRKHRYLSLTLTSFLIGYQRLRDNVTRDWRVITKQSTYRPVENPDKGKLLLYGERTSGRPIP
jgi:isopenicillin N synthase-like dioxygenase